MVGWARPEANACYSGEIPETQVQKAIEEGLHLLGFVTLDFSQGRETQQTEGIPDLWAGHPVWHVAAWIEVKRPHLVVPGVRPNTTRILQAQGRLSWAQEQLHQILRAAGNHVVTVDSADEALAYFAWLGYPVPPLMYRHPFNPEAQTRFVDPRARQTWEREKARQRFNRQRPKRGSRVRGGPSAWTTAAQKRLPAS